MSLRAAFEATPEDDVPAVKKAVVEKPVKTPLPLQGSAKSSHPEWKQKTVYLRKSTVRAVELKLLQTESEQDFSDVCEELLQRWAKN